MESQGILAATLASQFSRADQKKGADYCYDYDCVRDVNIEGNRIYGMVYGSRDYEVELYFSLNSGGMKVTDLNCSCPYHSKGHNCKHIWALILECDYLATQDARWASFLSAGAAGEDRLDQLLAVVSQRSRVSSSVPVHNEFLFGAAKKQQEQLAYVFDISDEGGGLKLLLYKQKQKKNGGLGAATRFKFEKESITSAPAESQQLLRALTGYEAPSPTGYSYYYSDRASKYEFFDVSVDWSDDVWEMLAKTERTFWAMDPDGGFDAWRPVAIDVEKPYSLELNYDEKLKTKTKVLIEVNNGESTIANDQIVKAGTDGIGLAIDRLFKIANPELFPLLSSVLQDELVILKKDRAKFVELLDRIPNADRLPLPESWGIDKAAVEPVVGVEFHQGMRSKHVWARVFFEYGSETFSWGTHEQARFDGNKKSLTMRSLSQEQARLQQLLDTGIAVQPADDTDDASFKIAAKDFVPLASALATLGWKVLWKGKPLRVATGVTASVGGQHDWFNLDAKVQFSGTEIALPQVLAALKRKEEYVTLHDGTLGHIPQGMLDRYAKIAQFGEIHDDTIRFKPSQAMILDAMLESQPGVQLDGQFKDYRKKIQKFDGVKAVKPTKGFQGKLRSYQEDGLAWLNFLQEFKLGGCLADDMGLGKTVQVLALLEKRRIRRVLKADAKQAKKPVSATPDTELTEALGISKEVDPWCEAVNQFKRKPTIVVVPKSLIFNWVEEAAKFAPKLRVLNYTGSDRKAVAYEFGEFDVLLTTYSTMRIDVQRLSQIGFDYAILDESQAIKNSSALVAKASRLLRSDFRLAMTGTPIENHLGELWSLFEFLNPGMLGNLSGFKAMTRIKPDDNTDNRAIEALAAGLKPFFLRRTKTQVLKELPEKTEQLLTCEMTKPQRKQYDELKEYYRVKLKKKVETEGLGKSKIHVLEALLRLRQVACDPRLVDPAAKPGAKLELLQQQLEEVVGGGSKALVFSQFTSLLSLLKDQLDAAGITYEYLDGKTSNRAAKVKNFQENDDVQVFLISLKAGGSGLNLTAAQYVYLLDPWWNPAVEAQAIDRAHRMGQKDPVFAYRMTCKDSVEDKILKMQSSKKKLAESVINADDSLLRNLSSDDLAMLLG